MAIVTVIYPSGQGATFDFAYYKSTHVPLLIERWGTAGLKGIEALRGVAGADGGEPPFLAVTSVVGKDSTAGDVG